MEYEEEENQEVPLEENKYSNDNNNERQRVNRFKNMKDFE